MPYLHGALEELGKRHLQALNDTMLGQFKSFQERWRDAILRGHGHCLISFVMLSSYYESLGRITGFRCPISLLLPFVMLLSWRASFVASDAGHRTL